MPRHAFRSTPYTLCAMCALLLAAGSAPAQEPPEGSDTTATIPVTTSVDAAEPTSEQATTFDTVTVTAQKRVQSLQEVPASVGVINRDTLEQTGSFDAASLGKYSPNIQIDNDPQAPVIGIRGFSTETDNVGFEPSVGLTFDDLALARPEFIADGFFDMERIEILRGTQGTLFGKNTIAGVINFRTVEPEDAFAGDLTATYGDPLQRRGEAGVTVPVTDWLSARVSGVYWKRDGDIYNSTLDRYESSHEQQAGRLKLALYPMDAMRIGLSTQLSRTDVLYAPWQFDDADEDALAFARQYDPSTEDDPFDSHTAQNFEGYVARGSRLTRGILTYDFDELWGMRSVQATAIAGRAEYDIDTVFDIDSSAADLVNVVFDNFDVQDSVELRMSGLADSLFGLAREVNYVVGVFALRSSLVSRLDNFAGQDLGAFAASPAGQEALGGPGGGGIGLPFPPPGTPINDWVYRPFDQDGTSQAIFGEMTWNLTGQLATVLGARYGRDHKKAHFDVSVEGGIIGEVVGAEPFTADLTRDESDFAPKVGLQYQWTPALFSYATWTRGFKGGGFNATADNDENLEFDAERATGLEAGLKTEWFDRALTMNLSAYRTDVANLQTVAFTGVSFKVSNAGEARLQGVEIDARWRPEWRWLTVTASAALSRATYLSYDNAPVAPEDEDSEACADQDPCTQDLTGKTLAHAPEITATLSPAVTLPLWGDLGIIAGVDLSYRGDQFSSVDLDSHSFQKAHALLGARLVIGPASQNWAMIVNGSNLTNEHTRDLVVNNPVYANSWVAQQVGRLRSVSVSIQARFY